MLSRFGSIVGHLLSTFAHVVRTAYIDQWPELEPRPVFFFAALALAKNGGIVMETAKNGDRVKVHFTGHIKDGDLFSTTHGADPVTIEIGAGNALAGLETGVVGMQVGEQKKIEVSPKEGFGPHLPDLVAQVKKELLPSTIQPEIGLTLQTRQEGDEPVEMTIVDMDENTVTLDANHPLAGHTLVFEIELLEIEA